MTPDGERQERNEINKLEFKFCNEKSLNIFGFDFTRIVQTETQKKWKKEALDNTRYTWQTAGDKYDVKPTKTVFTLREIILNKKIPNTLGQKVE